MIYIAAHKNFDEPKIKGYASIQVGAKGRDSLGYQRDDEGDNISIKNPNYCELTGLYWIWKNCNDEYKGLVHYRRYFGKSNLSSSKNSIYSYEEMVKKLDKADIVLPYNEYFLQDAKDEILISCCTDEIFNQLRDSVYKLYPDYIQDFDEFFSQNKCTLFNMMFCKKELFDDYCEWLFSILFELEKHVDLELLNDYQKRLYGFLSERLLNVWVRHNKLVIENLPVINIEMSLDKKVKLLRRRFTNRIRWQLRKKV